MKNGSTKAFYTQTKISVDLQTAFAADTHPAEGLWLEEQLNVVRLRMFRVGTRMRTIIIKIIIIIMQINGDNTLISLLYYFEKIK
jgi:hypothetical protein